MSNLIALGIESEDLDRVRAYSQRLLKVDPHSPVAADARLGDCCAGGARIITRRRAITDRIVQLAPDCLEAWHNLRVALDRILTSFTSSKLEVVPGEVK